MMSYDDKTRNCQHFVVLPERSMFGLDDYRWLKRNCQGEFYSYRRAWYFEKKEDAVLFKLKYT